MNFIDELNGWTVGYTFWPQQGGVILRTTDGGISWDSTQTTNWLFSLYFIDSQIGWAVGWVGTILHTTNGGIDWATQNSRTDCDFQTVHFIDPLVGWAAGYGGIVVKTSDGGNNWETLISDAFCSCDDIYFTDSLNGWVVGGNPGNILKSTDGGQSWFIQVESWQMYLQDIYFINSQCGWIVGDYGINILPYSCGIIFVTSDGGENWTELHKGTYGSFSTVIFSDINMGWIAGGCAILKTTNGGVSFIEEQEIDEIPNTILVFQNYPNPFNPKTKIKYQIPELSFVRLKVYDVLGSEIETLVNEEKPAGNYEVKFDATNLPSGIYFYRLHTGDYISTKKMVLIK